MALTASTVLPNTAVQAGGRPRGSTITALRDNIVAGLECDPTAPVNAACWHPYNKVFGNDGNDGKFYDFAVDGAVASVETPIFVDGWEYRIRWESLSAAGPATMFFDGYRETGATYTTDSVSSVPVSQSGTGSGWFEIATPMITKRTHFATWSSVGDGANTITGNTLNTWLHAMSTAQKTSRIKLRFVSFSLDAGKMFLDKRRAYF